MIHSDMGIFLLSVDSIGTGFMCHSLLVYQKATDPGITRSQAGEKQEDGNKAQGFKGEKEAKQRSQAGNRAAWNTLFMRADTVAEAIAAHLGMPKAQLLDREAADLPVRMALGEAHVINLTKQSLGMLLDSNDGCAVRR